MNDRELLEKAARAAGIAVYDWLPGRAGFAHGDSITNRWNPLADDGDALRLAVKLNLDIEFDTLPDGPIVVCAAPWNDEFGEFRWMEWLLKDAAAATRRAIVRAAAAIGEKT
jgi:hypothetical protein